MVFLRASFLVLRSSPFWHKWYKGPFFFSPRGGEGCVFRFHFHASLSQVTESLSASWIWWMCHQGWQEGKRQSARFLRRHRRPVAISPDYMSVKYAIFQELFRAVGIFVLALSVPEIAQHNNQTVFWPPRMGFCQIWSVHFNEHKTTVLGHFKFCF